MARDSFSSSRLTWPFFSLKQLSSSQEAMSLANRKTKMTFRDQFSPLARHIERWRSRVQQVYGQGSKALAFASLPCPATSLPWCVCGGGLGHCTRRGRRTPGGYWVQGPSKGHKEQTGFLLSWDTQHWPGPLPATVTVRVKSSPLLRVIVMGSQPSHVGSHTATGSSSHSKDEDTGTSRNTAAG